MIVPKPITSAPLMKSPEILKYNYTNTKKFRLHESIIWISDAAFKLWIITGQQFPIATDVKVEVSAHDNGDTMVDSRVILFAILETTEQNYDI